MSKIKNNNSNIDMSKIKIIIQFRYIKNQNNNSNIDMSKIIIQISTCQKIKNNNSIIDVTKIKNNNSYIKLVLFNMF